MMMKTRFHKYKNLIVYVMFGALTTLINFATFWLFTQLLGESYYLINNVIAWVVSVIFAYITNKVFVFASENWTSKVLMKEIPEFFLARLFSFLLEEGGLFLCVEVLHFDRFTFSLFSFEITGQLLAKLLLSVIVVILNYIFSKLVIFRKR